VSQPRPTGIGPAAEQALTLVFSASNGREGFGDRAAWHPLRELTGHQETQVSSTPGTPGRSGRSQCLIRHTFTRSGDPLTIWQVIVITVTIGEDADVDTISTVHTSEQQARVAYRRARR
jgi:hypothetical protein